MHDGSPSGTVREHLSERHNTTFKLPAIVQYRLNWIHFYEEKKEVQLVCQKFGISRKTFYKWLKRYRNSHGDPASLQDTSRKPHHFPRATPKEVVKQIVQAKKETGYGQRRLKRHLAQVYDIHVSEHTIWKMLKRSYAEGGNGTRKHVIERENYPGSCVEIAVKDITMYINHDQYVQYTGLDRSTRLRISKIYRKHSWSSASDFVKLLLEKFPFAIKELLTPPDGPFTDRNPSNGVSSILFEPVPTILQKTETKQTVLYDSQNRNSKAHALHKQDEEEFFRLHSYRKPEELTRALSGYVTRYNNHRRHEELNGLTPLQRLRMYPEFKHVLYFDPYS